MAYRDGQPFNRNHLRPCPMLENPGRIKQMVEKTGAKDTNFESHESVDHLLEKTVPYAKAWQPVADEYWKTHKHPHPKYENFKPENRDDYATSKSYLYDEYMADKKAANK